MGNKKATPPYGMKNRRLNAKVLVLAILFAGTLFTWWTAVRTDREMRSDLLVQTRLVAKSLNIARIQALSGTTEDLKIPDYQRIKEQITDVRSANPQCRFVYLIGRKTDGQIFFFVDSEPTVSKNYALPGQGYKNAPAGYRRVFDTKTEAVEGPVTDNRGTRVLALVPISDPQTGAALAVLGVDIDARTWKWNMVARSALPVGMMLILLIGMTAVFFYIRRTDAGIRARQAALRESENLYHSLFDNTLNGLAYCRMLFEDGKPRDFIFLSVNAAFESQTGIKGVTGKKVSEVIPGIQETDPQLIETYGRVSTTGQPESFEIFVKATNMFLSVSVYSPTREYFVAVFDVITERKRSEDELREREETLRAYIENSFDIIFTLNKEGIFDFISPAWERHFGYPASDAIGKAFASFVHPDDLAPLTEYLKIVLGTGKSATSPSYRVKHVDGNWRWFITNGTPYVTPKGDHLFIGVGRNVTEQKQDEEKLKQRFKELTCLYSLSALIESPGISLEEILKKTVMFLSQAWQFPEITEASIELEGQFFQTAQFRETPWVLAQTITVRGKSVGQLRVCYLEERPASDEGPFLIEERQLIKAVAERIGRIVERIRAEDELRESEERIHSITNSAHEAIIMMDNNGRISYWNPAAERILGYTSEEAIGKNLHKLITPERFLSAHRAAFPEFQKTGQGNAIGKTLELVARRKDGREIDVALSLSAVKIKGAWHAVGILRDITERKQAESMLRESDERYKALFDSSLDLVYLYDFEGRFIDANAAALNRLGYTREEIHSLNFASLLSEDQFPLAFKTLQEIQETGIQKELVEFRLRHKNGSDVYVETIGSTIMSDGKPVAIQSIARDITERKQAEEALKESGRIYRLLADNVNDVIFILDMNLNYTYVSPSIKTLRGYEPEEVLKKQSLDQALTPSSRDLAMRTFSEIMELEKIKQIELNESRTIPLELKRKDGTTVWTEVKYSFIRDENQQPVGILGVTRDITERKKAEEKLTDLNRRLETAIAKAHYLTVQADIANAAKSDFLANMSHEIRTPMNAIIGMADLLWDSQLTTDQRQYVQIFRSAGENLLLLINDILDLAKVESGRLNLEHIPYDLFDIVDKTNEVLALRAHSRKLELACRISPDVPQYIMGDPTRLRQVLMNILGNAIKFTEKGEIVLTVLSLPPDASKETPRFLQFSVRDTGIGIPADKLDTVFEKFTQSDTSSTRKYEGTGLGLTISKQFVELMGGKIRVESRLGEGCTFFFTIPLEEAPPQKDQKPAFGPEINLQGMNILIVDDNATNRFILREILSQWGCVVTEASNGTEGLTALEKAKNEGAPFRVAILDSQMPEMDGFTLAQKIRGKSDFAALSILMLTSETRSSDRKKAKSVDITGYLIKPVKKDALRNALQMAMGGEEILYQPQTPPEELFAENSRPLHILLVEDSEDNRFLVQAFLKNTNYLIDTAENGQIAVDKFISNVYDLILMDVQMPVMDGYTATREIRRREREEKRKPTPIVALTAHALKEDMQKSLQSGCDTHLTKPIHKQVLLETIRKFASPATVEGDKV